MTKRLRPSAAIAALFAADECRPGKNARCCGEPDADRCPGSRKRDVGPRSLTPPRGGRGFL
jgi:hypothetical protein